MARRNKEVDDDVLKRFGTNKRWDEKFSRKSYWESLPENDHGKKIELKQGNPDQLTADQTPWKSRLTEEQKVKLEDVQNGFKILTPAQREALLLYSRDGLTMDEIAIKLNIGKRSVFERIQFARKKLLAYHTQQKAKRDTYNGDKVSEEDILC